MSLLLLEGNREIYHVQRVYTFMYMLALLLLVNCVRYEDWALVSLALRFLGMWLERCFGRLSLRLGLSNFMPSNIVYSRVCS